MEQNVQKNERSVTPQLQELWEDEQKWAEKAKEEPANRWVAPFYGYRMLLEQESGKPTVPFPIYAQDGNCLQGVTCMAGQTVITEQLYADFTTDLKQAAVFVLDEEALRSGQSLSRAAVPVEEGTSAPRTSAVQTGSPYVLMIEVHTLEKTMVLGADEADWKDLLERIYQKSGAFILPVKQNGAVALCRGEEDQLQAGIVWKLVPLSEAQERDTAWSRAYCTLAGDLFWKKIRELMGQDPEQRVRDAEYLRNRIVKLRMFGKLPLYTNEKTDPVKQLREIINPEAKDLKSET